MKRFFLGFNISTEGKKGNSKNKMVDKELKNGLFSFPLSQNNVVAFI